MIRLRGSSVGGGRGVAARDGFQVAPWLPLGLASLAGCPGRLKAGWQRQEGVQAACRGPRKLPATACSRHLACCSGCLSHLGGLGLGSLQGLCNLLPGARHSFGDLLGDGLALVGHGALDGGLGGWEGWGVQYYQG